VVDAGVAAVAALAGDIAVGARRRASSIDTAFALAMPPFASRG
jgi:hypothetical protein